MYVPLKITTDYSLLKSMIKIDDLMAFLIKKEIKSCAIVDENLFGCIEFYHKCLKNHIQPIVGISLCLQENEVYFYAKNYQGYQNLLKLESFSHQKELELNDLEAFKDEVMVILPYTSRSLYSDLKTFFDVYLGYQNEAEKKQVLLISEKIVFVHNICALFKEDVAYLDYLEMIEKDIKVEDYEKKERPYAYLLEDVLKEDEQTTVDFAKQVDLKIPMDLKHIPPYKNELEDSYLFLKNLSLKGLKKRLNGEENDDYLKRLDYELSVIQKMGFCDYILIVYDYVLYAKKKNIFVGPGRGSAAGSLVCYVLGITDIDPIKYHLLFERFLNPERITMPDIDIDFENRRREEIIDYITERYGKEQVASIVSFSTLKSKLALKEIARVLAITSPNFENLLKEVSSKVTLKENLEKERVKKLLNADTQLKKIYHLALKLEGLKKNSSKHAAGVVISDVPLLSLIPVMKEYDGSLTTGITKDYLEELGLLKMDLLAIENLTMLSNILELIYKEKKIKINLNKINLEDKEVLNLFCSGNTEGVFQFESVGMKSFLQKLKPRCFTDLVAAIALYRPGPMDNISSFIRRKEGQEEVCYLHPDLMPILKETEGIIVYQEQVMQLLVLIADYSFAEADLIRRAMSKKEREVILNEEERFIKRAINKGYTEALAKELFQLILKFADYGFNKSHSVAYALIGYWMAYLKVKTKAFFLINLLNMSIGSEQKTKEYLVVAKRYRLHLVHPHINLSEENYFLNNQDLVLPLSIIKGINPITITQILEERKKNGSFQDYIDFVRRTFNKNVNQRILELLIGANTLREFGNMTTLKENLENVFTFAKLSEGIDSSLLLKPVIKEYPDDSDLLASELKSYGFYITNHPTSIYTDSGLVKLEHLKDFFDRYIRVVVLVESIRETKTKKGEAMAFIEASDETGNGLFIVFSKQMNLIENLKKQEVVEIQGRVTKRFDTYQMNVNNIIKK